MTAGMVNTVDISGLSVPERVALMQRLWETLSAADDGPEPPDWHAPVTLPRTILQDRHLVQPIVVCKNPLYSLPGTRGVMLVSSVEPMNVAEEQLEAAVQALRSHGARRVLLFGSSVTAPETARDLDLAVEGIPLRRLLDAELAVYRVLETPFDLVSREEAPAFYDRIREHARVLHDEG